MKSRRFSLVTALVLSLFLAASVDVVLSAPQHSRYGDRADDEDDRDPDRRGTQSGRDEEPDDPIVQVTGYSDLRAGDLVELPMPDGRMSQLQLTDAPLLSEALRRDHPDIRAFRGTGPGTAQERARLVVIGERLHGIVQSTRGAALIDASDRENVDSRWVESNAGGSLACGTPELAPAPVATPEFVAGADLRSYRLVITSAGEYTLDAGSAANALADIVLFVNDLNGLYERDAAITFVLEDTIIFEDPATDPFPEVTEDPAAVAFQDLIAANQVTLDATLGLAAYDLGLVITRSNPPATVGRASASSVCDDLAKGTGGVASEGPLTGDTVGALAHEIGHMFSATHTYNSTLGDCLERDATTAYEPGSGSTVMGGGNCDVETVSGPDGYFHNASIEQILAFRDGAGSCGLLTVTGNSEPSVDAGPDVTVPLNTPFVLTAAGADADLDDLTYTWEQFDAGAASPPLNDVDGPLFRSLEPGSDPSRTFPSLANLLSGNADPFERLATVDRTLTFRSTVRDQNGGVADDETVVTVTGEPFQVLSPNGGEVLNGGCEMSVLWSVGGGITSATVNILVSLDGGATFETLAAATENDGEETVAVPCLSSESEEAWILIEATDGVFFDLSDAGFTVDVLAPEIVSAIEATPVDEQCESTISYTADITDDCGVDALDVVVTPIISSANATLGVPFLDLQQVTPTLVAVSGNVVVSQLTSSPVLVRVQFVATDSCDIDTDVDAEIMISDLIPPTITCPEDVVVECSAFGGVPSDDPQLVDFFAGVSAEDNCDPDPAITNDGLDFYPLGTTPVEFVATDASGNSTACTALVTVQDTTDPEVDASVTPTLLWPPNHKLIDIEAQVFATDICDPSPVVVLESIESSESNNGRGDGNTADDVSGADLMTLDLMFQLRAERAGPGKGREYTINYTATDQSGNVGIDSPVVKVPHDKGRRRGPKQGTDKPAWRNN